MIWKTILVPHDFSASASHAAALARDEAKAHGGSLLLLHVVDIPPSFGPDTTLVIGEPSAPPVGMREYAIQQATNHLEDLANRLRADGVDVAIAVKTGGPVDEIVRFAIDRQATAIVMGTHGRTGVKHLLIGSVTERVVRISPIPVLTTRHE